MLLADKCRDVPRSVAVRIAGKVRSENKNGVLCCSSCHEDCAEGYAESGESWLLDDMFLGGDKAYKKRDGQPPWALQFCCCAELRDFEEEIDDWLKERVG